MGDEEEISGIPVAGSDLEAEANEDELWDDEIEAIASNAKSLALDNSKPFDVHRWSDHPEVGGFVDIIYDDHFQVRKTNIRKKHLGVLLLDLYVAWSEDPSIVIAIHRNKNAYKAKTRYNELHISWLTIEILDKLIEAGLVRQEIGFYDRDKSRGKISRIRASDNLIELFREARFSVFDIGCHKDRLSVVLRRKDPKPKKNKDIDYEPTEATERMSAVLNNYNNLIASTFIDIPSLEDPWIETTDNGKSSKIHVNQSSKYVRRIFNRGSFECGGRFWGGWWQRCPSKWRPHIFINNKPTTEIDYSGLHVIMLYAREGVDYWEEVGSDPYGIPKPEFLDSELQARQVTKSLLLLLLNAKNTKLAYSAFRNKANAGSHEQRLNDTQLAEVQRLIEDKHPVIAEYFGADAGVTLMNQDSRITEIILENFVSRSVPVLSIHDSYIIQVGREDELIEIMDFAFEQVMGMPLTAHNAQAMKEQSARVEDLEAAMMAWMPYENIPWQDENEKALKARCYPERSKRYEKSWNLFQEWIKSRDDIKKEG